mgnify:CR=1 FL=1
MTLPHQAAIAAHIVEKPTRPRSEAVRAGGLSNQTALHAASRTTNAKGVQEEIRRLCSKAGISDKRVFAKVGDLLDAETIKGKGEVCADNAVQLATAQLCLRLKGYLRDEHDSGQVLVVVLQQIMPVIMPFVPEDRRGDLLRQLKAAGTGGGAQP